MSPRLLAAVAALLGAGCSLLLGAGCSLAVAPTTFDEGEEEEGALPSVERCGYRLPVDDTCGICQEERCCEQLTACKGKPDCDELLSCLSRCQRLAAQAECRTECLRATAPSPRGPIGPIIECMAGECGEACGGCSGMNFVAGETCGECLTRANACEPLTSCLDEDECRSGYVCGVTCSDPACVSRCGLEIDEDDLEQIGQVFDRIQVGCSAACDLGSAWECVGEYAWGTVADDGDVAWRITLIDGTTRQPAPGLSVRACNHADIHCEDPVATKHTGDDGVAELMIPLRAAQAGFDGFVLIEGTVTGEDEPIVPTVFQEDQPLLSARTTTALAVTAEELGDLASAVGVEGGLDENAAQVGVLVRDCLSASAAGVRVSVELGGQSYDALYLSGAMPDPTADKTDSSGSAIFYNVAVATDQPLIGIVTAVDAETGEVRRRRPIGIRGGWLSTVLLVPTPSE